MCVLSILVLSALVCSIFLSECLRRFESPFQISSQTFVGFTSTARIRVLRISYCILFEKLSGSRKKVSKNLQFPSGMQSDKPHPGKSLSAGGVAEPHCFALPGGYILGCLQVVLSFFGVWTVSSSHSSEITFRLRDEKQLMSATMADC